MLPAALPFAHPAAVSRRRVLALLGAAWPLRARADLPATIRTLRPSVVAVGSYSATDAPRFGFRGSGVVVDDGLTVLTCRHVLPDLKATAGGMRRLAVLVPGVDGKSALRVARLVADDAARDLAVLRIDGAALPAAPLADPAPAAEGTAVVVAGFPVGGVFGYAPVFHRGIVSAVTTIALPAPNAGRLDAVAALRLRDGAFAVYQLDATAFPGNSGGPVVDADSGRVLGIVNMVLIHGTRESALSRPTGITYALPIALAAPLLARR